MDDTITEMVFRQYSIINVVVVVVVVVCKSKCPFTDCGESFSKHQKLSLHVVRHSKELRPFKCDAEGCHASFVWPSQLKKHQKSHRGTC